jgi:hypothetical protein
MGAGAPQTTMKKTHARSRVRYQQESKAAHF